MDSTTPRQRQSKPASVCDAEITLPRRDFLKVAGAGAGLILLGDTAAAEQPPISPTSGAGRIANVRGVSASPDIIVIGAGIWGSSTAYHLRKMGANVTLVDAYGPGNARASSGDESRGVRSSYGDRPGAQGELWTLWARESMTRWKAFDEEWGHGLRLNLFHVTGDLIYRTEWDNFQLRCKVWWDKHKIPYEVLNPEDVKKAYPVISIDDITAILYEPDAGVVRARRATQSVASAFETLGGKIVIGRATPSQSSNGRMQEVVLDTGERLHADTFVFAVGPWLGKTFPELFAKKMRLPVGYVCYFATPLGDERFTYPNMPTFNFPGVTGWPALPVDNRGFRVRGSERAPTPKDEGDAKSGEASFLDIGSNLANEPPLKPGPAPRPEVPPEQQDPDTSDRWASQERVDGSRRFVAHRFPLLANAAISQTHACHYAQTSSGDFIIDRHPGYSNVWIAAGGNAEGFKFGLKIGDYVSQRVMGMPGDQTLDDMFKIPTKDYDEPKPATTG